MSAVKLYIYLDKFIHDSSQNHYLHKSHKKPAYSNTIIDQTVDW